jgi:FkbM family methyltransferase
MNNDETIDFVLEGQSIKFRYPNSEFEKNIVLLNFKGYDYPVIPLYGYSPKIIIDIGAHIGSTCVYFHAHYPEANLYAFEPNIHNYEYLQDNTKYFDKIATFQYGLFDKELEVPLYTGKDNSGQSSVMKNNSAENFSEIIKLKRASDEIKKLNIEKISILKIDTEGCEVPVLKDIEPMLKDIELIYLEYHSEDDRLEIDQILSPYFLLYFSRTSGIHQGVVTYISKKLAKNYPGIESSKIKRYF